ncbi:helix-turn-helix transcriptional regulator [Micromonospora sp. NPDC049559]|uniref:helix-turn-helix domain-containing protein n=1 Tax=Micromonospora sp. NPDC049559 TaxID=3155923 RepID=UPI003438102D
MAVEVGSTVARRRLGRYLRELRERARISQDEAATALACSRQKIWRIESGAVPVRPRDVKVLCNLYLAGPRITRELADLAGGTQAKGWWHAYGDGIPEWLSLGLGLEAAAERLRHYNGELVPELLRTVRYATAIGPYRSDLTEAQRYRADDIRARRQRLLSRQFPPPPRYEVVLSEAVLRRRIADRPGMRDQLDHLDRASGWPNVSLRVLPLEAGPTLAAAAGAFTILDFPPGDGMTAGEPTTVFRESLTGGGYLSRDTDVAAYEEAWAGLDKVALDESQSRALLRSVLAELAE